MTQSIGYGLLAMAVSASLALANGGGEDEKGTYQGAPNAWSYKPGSGLTYDGGDAFGITIYNHLQLTWSYTNNDKAPDVNTFGIPRARTAFRGHAYNKHLTYFLQLDATDTGGTGPGATGGPIKDGWAQYDFLSNNDGHVGLRMGQSKTYHGLESTGSDTSLFFTDRSLATRTLGNTRSRGAWLHGTHAENKLRWVAGAQNGDVANGNGGISEIGEERPNADNELNFVGSVNFDPFGDFVGDGKPYEMFKQGALTPENDWKGTIGAGVLVGNNRDVANANDVDSTSVNINTAWRYNTISIQGEVFLRNDKLKTAGASSEGVTGWYAQVGYCLPKSGDSDLIWGAGLRLSQLSTDNTVTFITGSPIGAVAGNVIEITAVVDAFYHGHGCKTQVEYTWQELDPDAGSKQNNHIIKVLFNLVF